MFNKVREMFRVWRLRWSKNITSWDEATKYGERVVKQKQEVDDGPSRFALTLQGIRWLICNAFYTAFAIALTAFGLWLLMQIPIPWITRR